MRKQLHGPMGSAPSQHAWRAPQSNGPPRWGPGQGPAAGGRGNAHRDHGAAAYAQGARGELPRDAPRRIAMFCMTIAVLGMGFNLAMLRRAQRDKDERGKHNQLLANRASLIAVTKPDIYDLWRRLRQQQREDDDREPAVSILESVHID
jgi:hypothetical protein